jgi:histone H3/H4
MDSAFLIRFMPKVLRTVHASLSLSKPASQCVASMALDVTRRVVAEVKVLMRRTGQTMMHPRDLKSAMLLVLPPGMVLDAATRAGDDVVKALGAICDKFSLPPPGLTTHALDALVLPVRIARQALNQCLGRGRLRVSKSASAFWAGALEEVCARVLEAGGACTAIRNKSRVQPQDVMAGLEACPEVKPVFVAGR